MSHGSSDDLKTGDSALVEQRTGLGSGDGERPPRRLRAANGQSFSYDGLPRLTKVTDSTTPGNTATYGYDVADNPITLGATAQAFNAANELCWTAPTAAAGTNRACGTPAAGAKTYTYSPTGNRTAVTPASGPATSFGYDAADRLTSITGAVSATYSYDGDGLRTSKTTGGVSSSFGWNDESGIPLLLRDRNDYYVYGPDGVPLERLGSSPTLYLHTDQQDSIRLVTDTAGNAACTASYTPWGAVTWT